MLLIAVAAGAIAAALLSYVRPELASRLPGLLVPLAAVASAVVVALAETAPTGWEPFDLLLRAGFGALVPLAAARAGSIATGWLVIVAVVVLVIVSAPVPGVAGVAAGAFLGLAAAGLATSPAAAVAAACAIAPMAHADWFLITGDSATAMAVATVPALLVGFARADRPVRRAGWIAFGVVVVVGVVGSIGGGLAALDARDDVDRAVDLATDGIDFLGDDDERARELLAEAADHFDAAEDALTVWWARPALAVPGVAQQSRAVSTMASAGADLARTAAEESEDADVDSIRPRDGQVDLAALADLQEPLDNSLQALRRASDRLDGIESPLLLAPVADRLVDLRTEVDDALGSAELAAHAVSVAPEMLGADGPRRYFIAFQNPAELTGNGGFMGNWAELTAVGGRLELTRNGRSRDLTQAGDREGRRIDTEPEFARIYTQNAAEYWGAINFSPDHPTVSRVMAELYPESGGQELDGVVAITPKAFAGFLEITGPISVPGYPQELTSENVERIMVHEQYLEFAEETGEDREGFLSEAVELLFDELTEGDLPGPTVLAEELGPAVEGRYLQLWSRHDDEQALFARIGADGDATRPRVDSFGVVTQNYNGNKIDWFLARDIAYDVEWDPASGGVSGTISATITNGAPASGLPPSIISWGGDEELGQRPVADGENFMNVVVYSNFPIEQVTVDGEEVGWFVEEELGHETARLFVSVPSESTREVVATFSGTVEETDRYVVEPIRQPTINPDDVTVRVTVASDEWEIDEVEGLDVAGNAATATTTAAEPIEAVVEVERTGSLTLLERLRGVGD